MPNWDKAITTISNAMRDRIGNRENKYMRSAWAEVLRIDQAVSALTNIVKTRSPTETPDAHFKRVSATTQRLKLELSNAEERLRRVGMEGAQDIDSRINQALGLNENAYAAEFRQVLRTMSSEERNAALRKMIDAHNGEGLAAVLNAPGMLSGIDDAQREDYRESYVQSRAPALIAERDLLTSTIADVSTVIGTARRAVSDYSDPNRLKEIEDAERLTAIEQDRFNRAFAGE